MAFRGEVSEYAAVTRILHGSRCGVSGVERKARRYLEGLRDATEVEVREHSLARCIERIFHVFCAKGGCDNTRAERLVSMLTYLGLTLHSKLYARANL